MAIWRQSASSIPRFRHLEAANEAVAFLHALRLKAGTDLAYTRVDKDPITLQAWRRYAPHAYPSGVRPGEGKGRKGDRISGVWASFLHGGGQERIILNRPALSESA